MFLFSRDYFFNSISTAGGLSGYLGEFFTQFYIIPFGGPVIILFWLLSLQQLFWKILKRSVPGASHFYILSFLPSIWYCTILSEEFYLLSGLISVVIALTGVLLYTAIRDFRIRSIVGLLIVLLVYFTAGGSYILFVLFTLSFEFVKRGSSIGIKGWLWSCLVLEILLAVFLPVIYRLHYDPVPVLQAYITEHFHKISTVFPFPVVLIWILIAISLPIVLYFDKKIINRGRRNTLYIIQVAFLLLVFLGGHSLFANPKAEYIKKLDYHVRHNNWEEIISLCENRLPRNAFAVNYLNLALAKTNQLGERLFHFEQIGPVGLFLPYEREQLSAMIGNETYYHIGLVNVSQQYIFEATEAMPDLRKSTRSLQRLTDVAIINGDYELANKYIQLLKKTFFYKDWAEQAEDYLYNESKINNHPDWGEKRRLRPIQDYFFSVENMDQILLALLRDHPDHKMAFEYLMSYYLVRKDIESFMKYVHLGHEMNYKYLPVAFQEAVLYVLGLKSQEAVEQSNFPIEERTKNRLYEYVDIYTRYPNAQKLLEKEFSDSFWYYYHYR